MRCDPEGYMPKKSKVQNEEQIAQKRHKNLEAARAARSAKAKEKNDNIIWAYLETRLNSSTCKCGLKKGMTLEDLRPLGCGCTAPNYVCRILDAYRRLLQNPNRLKEIE
jgi:hypothetical protein